ncbi:LytTR family transcriptional regulator DNA-binding domain-containing protein [Cohnella boryungensis]|jgi:DNA-binding LytR/AlgR family response regulator|uniref:LytTR family transcriptional regulator DNA-binding domain-containing protein n=1 Tax=Cohnella boryungensis TaxID=768479 RepID=A0ABV8S606_9BACL
MNAALQEKNVYEDFEPRQDILFFKVGTHGLISFHGRNYNIKKRMSADERNRLIDDSATFFRVSSDCYVNVRNISVMGEQHLLFDDTSKRLPCSQRKQQMIRQLLDR